jgi:hypothetical protein
MDYPGNEPENPPREAGNKMPEVWNSFLISLYRMLRAQADWKFILPSELPTKELHHLPRKMPPQAYQTSQYVVPRGGIFFGKWRSSFARSSDGNINAQSACALNTRYVVACRPVAAQRPRDKQIYKSRY